MAIDLSVLDEPESSIDLSVLDDPQSSIDLSVLEQIPQEPEGLVENAKFIADDVSNQLNNTISSIAGAPVDLISFGLNKVSNAIADRDIVPQDSLGGSESIRKIIGSIPFSGQVRDEPAKTKAGVAAQVAGEAITFTIPALKVAQVASKVQATSKAGQVGVSLAKQFTEEASKNTGRFLAIESGAVAGQTGGRILSQEKDLSPGATLAVELLTGITGALAGDKTFGVSRTLINKARGKTAQEIMEGVARGDITYKDLEFKPVIDGQKKYGFEPINLKELEFTPVTPKKTVIEETIGEIQPLEVTVSGKKIPSEAPATPKDAPGTSKETVFKSGQEQDEYARDIGGLGFSRKPAIDTSLTSLSDDALESTKLNTNKKLEVLEDKVLGDETYGVTITRKDIDDLAALQDRTSAIENEEFRRQFKLNIDEYKASKTTSEREETLDFLLEEVFNKLGRGKDADFKLAYALDQIKREGLFDEFVRANQRLIGKKIDVDPRSSAAYEEVFEGEFLERLRRGKEVLDDISKGPAADKRSNGTPEQLEVTIKELLETPRGTPEPTPSTPTPSLLTPPKQTPSMPGITRQNFDEARSEIASNLLATQRTQLAVDAGNLNNYAPGSNKRPNRLFNRINSWLAPSKVVGREVMNEIDQAKGIIREAESVGIRAYNAVNRIKKSNPDNIDAIDENVNAFFLTGELDPSLAPIQTELSAWRSSTNKLRERLIAGMDDQTFMDLSPEIRQGLRNALEGSMDDKGGYLTTPYRLFEDPNFTPDPKLKKAALTEIKLKLIDEGYSSEVAAKKAQEKLDELKGNSAKTRELESSGGFRPVASESILRQQTFPGPAERAWLGEITEAGQRALLTSKKLSRLASAKAEDAEIVNILLDSGVASRTLKEGQVELKLKTVSGKTNIYVDPEVADSIYKLRYGQMINRGIRNPMGKVLDAFFTTNFLAKFSKVILNVGSYPVAALGSLTSAMSNGIMPNFSGMRRAAASFRSLENFVAGKSPQAKKEFYADLDKMDLYNLRPKSVDAADMEATLKKGFEILNKNILGKAIDIGGKAYSAFDVAMRYVTWKATQKELGKMFPNYTKEQIEAAAARMTNDTFPNYDKLSDIVREGAKYIFQPFIAHFAELSRVSYNQGKFALQMMRGNFGRDFGLDPSGANKMSMRMLGAKRLAALGLVTAGAKTLVKSKNEESGLDDKSVQEFKESILPPWMEATTAIITPNKDNPRKGFYVPPEYIIPQLGMTDAFSAAINGQPFEDYQAILKNRIFSQEGSLALQAITKIVTGRDQRGREIYIDPSFSAQAKVIGESLFDDIVKPGTFRTVERFNDAINGIGDRTVAQEVQSLFGYRVYTYDTDIAFRSKFREQSSLMKDAKGTYTSAFRDRVNGSISQQELDAKYNQMNTARSNRLDLVRSHYGNMGMKLLNYTLDEKIAIMKEGGLSSLDILDVIGGTYTDMPRNITDKTKDRYDEIQGDLGAKGKAILSLPKSDPYRQKLGLYHRKQMKAMSQNIDSVDSLIISLTPGQTADYLIRIGADKNSKILNTYLKKDPARLEIIKILDVRSSN